MGDINLENLCANKVRVMKRISAYIKEEDWLCENCYGYNTNCGHYKPYKNGCAIPMNKGIVAYRMYKQGLRK